MVLCLRVECNLIEMSFINDYAIISKINIELFSTTNQYSKIQKIVETIFKHIFIDLSNQNPTLKSPPPGILEHIDNLHVTMEQLSLP